MHSNSHGSAGIACNKMSPQLLGVAPSRIDIVHSLRIRRQAGSGGVLSGVKWSGGQTCSGNSSNCRYGVVARQGSDRLTGWQLAIVKLRSEIVTEMHRERFLAAMHSAVVQH